MRSIWQGETLPLENEVFDIEGDPADLSLAVCELALKFPDGNVVFIEPELSGNVMSVALTTDQTTLPGIYTYQFKVELAGEVKKTLGIFKVLQSVSI